VVESDRKVLTIYLKKPSEFRAVVLDVIKLWFDIYGVYQSKGDIILTSLCYTRDSLKNKEKPQETEITITSMYARVGK
jgi:hypothetical protein